MSLFVQMCEGGWRAVVMASPVKRLDLYANWKGVQGGGEDRLDVLHD